MLRDIATMLWKESRELLGLRGSTRQSLVSVGLTVFFIGIFFPLQAGSMWVESPVSVTTWFMVSFIFVSSSIADSFAGERERHTLDTLLSTRLPEMAILLGKLLASVIYAFTAAAVTALIGIITVNVVHGHGHVIYPKPEFLALGAALGFFAAVTAATIGILVSLKAATARQAQQGMGLMMMVVFFLPIILMQAIPKPVLQIFKEALEATGPAMMIELFFGVLAIVDIVLFSIARARFRRSRMLGG